MQQNRKNHNSIPAKALSLAVVLLMAVTLVFSALGPAFAVSDEEIDEKQEEIEDAQKKSEEAQAESEEAGAKAEEFMQKVEQAEQDIAATQVRIDEAQARIDETQVKLEKKQKEVEEQTEALNERLSAMYKTGTVGFIDVLLNSDNVSELITNMGMVHRILTNDKDILEGLREDYAEIEQLKKEQEEAKAEIEAEQAYLEQKRQEYAALADEYNRRMEEMAAEADRLAAEAQARQSEYDELIRKQREEKEAAARKAAEEAARAQGREPTEEEVQLAVSKVSSSGYIWPVESTLITQYFGYNKWAATHYSTGRHSGTDIGGMRVGTPIYAPCDGIISSVDYARYGLGYYVALADGEHYVFFFGHMCQWPSVSVGQYVSQGDLLGYVGSTGYSTGPHLHYELRIDGVRSDVLQLYPGMF